VNFSTFTLAVAVILALITAFASTPRARIEAWEAELQHPSSVTVDSPPPVM